VKKKRERVMSGDKITFFATVRKPVRFAELPTFHCISTATSLTDD
jgi:hypothetical protein